MTPEKEPAKESKPEVKVRDIEPQKDASGGGKSHASKQNNLGSGAGSGAGNGGHRNKHQN